MSNISFILLLRANKHLQTFHFWHSFIPLFPAGSATIGGKGQMWSSKTSGIPELTLCTLTPEVRDQAGDYVRPLTTYDSKAFG